MSPLFARGIWPLRSGFPADFKIECDALTTEDWFTIAQQIAKRVQFGAIYGIPRGGVPLAHYLSYHVTTGPRLVVDDVLSTGYTISQAMDRPDDIGFVAFARGPCPTNVKALFQMDIDPAEADSARRFMNR